MQPRRPGGSARQCPGSQGMERILEEVAKRKKLTVELLGEQRDRIKALEEKAAEVDDLRRVLQELAKRLPV